MQTMIGRVLTVAAVLFLVFDGVTKVMKVPQVVEATARLGFPENRIVLIGAMLLTCTVLYVIPRTTVIGALLLTGYLGGAVAAGVRIERSVFETVFPILFAVVVWAGVALRDRRARSLLSLHG